MRKGQLIRLQGIRYFLRLLFFPLGIMIALTSGFASPVSSLADSILALPATEQRTSLWNSIYPPKGDDTVAIVQFYLDLEKELMRRGESKLAREAWNAQLEYKTFFLHMYRPWGIQVCNDFMDEARKRGWKDKEAFCTIIKGVLYYRQLKFGPAFEYMQKGYEKAKALGFEHCPGITGYLGQIGQSYYEFGDYQGAIQFLREAILAAKLSTDPIQTFIPKNTLALAFQKMNQLDSAVYYFRSAHDEAERGGHGFWSALTNGNLGNIYYLQGKYEETIPLMKADFEESIKAKEWASAVNASMVLTSIFLKMGKTAEASFYLDFARKNINYGNTRDLAGFYRNMAEISKVKGDYPQAFIYIDSAQIYSDSLRRSNDARVINQSRLKIEVERHANEIKLLETVRSRQVLVRNSLLAILLLIGTIAGLWLNRQRLKRKKELELEALQRAKTEDELRSAQNELLIFTNALKEKNEIIDSFRTELDFLHQSGKHVQEERTDQLNQLLNSTILTEEDWKQFRILFDRVHPGFFIRLREKMPDLSPADTRLLALTKLQLAPKEMASMLGLTYEAIKKSRQRLRKKINLPEEGSLDELVDIM